MNIYSSAIHLQPRATESIGINCKLLVKFIVKIIIIKIKLTQK